MKWLRAIVVGGTVCASALVSLASCGDDDDGGSNPARADGSTDSNAPGADALGSNDGSSGGNDSMSASDTSTSEDADTDAGDADTTPIIDASIDYEVDAACGLHVSAVTVPPPNHVAIGTPLAYVTNPPAGGPHYPSWAHFQEYAVAPHDGYLVHAMEHGAAIFFYNCARIPSDAPADAGNTTDAGDAGDVGDASHADDASADDASADDASAASDASDSSDASDLGDASATNNSAACQQLIQGLRDVRDNVAADPLCTTITPPTRNRIIIVPRASLDVPVAASAWGMIYRASCFDPSTLLQFATAHIGKAPENFCAAGQTTF